MRTVDTKLEFGKSFMYNRKSKGPKMDPCDYLGIWKKYYWTEFSEGAALGSPRAIVVFWVALHIASALLLKYNGL